MLASFYFQKEIKEHFLQAPKRNQLVNVNNNWVAYFYQILLELIWIGA